MINEILTKNNEIYKCVDAYNTNFNRYYVLADKDGNMKIITHESLKNYKVRI